MAEVLTKSRCSTREGLRDLIACVNSQKSKPRHVGLRHRMTASHRSPFVQENHAQADGHQRTSQRNGQGAKVET
jgi:hypothetical protein